MARHHLGRGPVSAVGAPAELYEDTARRLYESGHAYACECTREQIDERTRNNQTPGYDGYCRERGLAPGPGRVLRFRVPDEGVTVVRDVVRGDVEFANSTIDDFVLVKSNGDPLFVLAVVVDDIDMGITHVIRARGTPADDAEGGARLAGARRISRCPSSRICRCS